MSPIRTMPDMKTTLTEWNDFEKWYLISGSIYIKSMDTAWHVWQTIKAYEKLKDKESKDQ